MFYLGRSGNWVRIISSDHIKFISISAYEGLNLWMQPSRSNYCETDEWDLPIIDGVDTV